MTGMTSRIIHSGLFPDSKKDSMIFNRFAKRFFFASEAVSFISVRSFLERSFYVGAFQKLSYCLGSMGDDEIVPILFSGLPVTVFRQDLTLLHIKIQTGDCAYASKFLLIF
jgi:hypothetical protein